MTVAQAIECQDNCNCPGPEVTVEFNFSQFNLILAYSLLFIIIIVCI